MRRITGELAGIAEQVMGEAAAVIRNAGRALRTATGQRKGRLHRAINDLKTLMGHTERVVAQTRSRLAGVMPESASRLVSLHDVDARPIRKGRLGKPVEFGYKAQILDNADGVILDHNLEMGNPPDAPQLAPAIERITAAPGRPRARSPPIAATAKPRWNTTSTNSVCARGDTPQKQAQCGSPGVRTPPSLPRESEMAHRIRGPDQPHQAQLRLEPHRTHRHRRSPNLVGHGVFAHNLVKIGALAA